MDIGQLILNFNIWGVAKIFVILALVIYVIFALVVVRQVKLMTEVVSGIMTGFLRLVSWVFFLFALGVLVLMIIFF